MHRAKRRAVLPCRANTVSVRGLAAAIALLHEDTAPPMANDDHANLMHRLESAPYENKQGDLALELPDTPTG